MKAMGSPGRVLRENGCYLPFVFWLYGALPYRIFICAWTVVYWIGAF